jgi:type IV secretory pathway VirB2 component (pilin)
VVIAFLILGTQLLRPEGIIPEGIQVAQDLTQLLSQVWGNFGFWLMIVGVVIALAGTLLTNQDGWGRLFADCTLILLSRKCGTCKQSMITTATIFSSGYFPTLQIENGSRMLMQSGQ